MGSLRLFLAILVIIAHADPRVIFPGINGSMAVRIFFMVSGFYMALILSEKYVANKRPLLWLFYSNRALRIFPLLWLMLGFEVIVALGLIYTGHPSNEKHWTHVLAFLADHQKWGMIGTYVVSQITAVGVDFLHLFSITTEGQWVPYHGAVAAGEFRGWRPFAMSQLWSVSCELVFYAFAPYVNRLRLRWLVLLIFAATAANYASYVALPRPLASVSNGFFSIMQSGYFLAGMLAYRLIGKRAPTLPRAVQVILPVALLASIVGFSSITRFHYTGAELLVYALSFAALPILFSASSRIGWDRTLGELSYPVYLVHLTVIRAADQLGLKSWMGNSTLAFYGFVIITTAVSVALAAAAVALVDDRINRVRQKRVATAG